MKYIDAEKLKAEIERQIEEEKNNLTEETNLYYGTRQQVRSTILRIIDSLQQEQPEVDLEKEMDSYFNEHFSPCVDGTLISERTGMEIDGNDYDDIARHFAEWGAIHLNARKDR